MGLKANSQDSPVYIIDPDLKAAVDLAIDLSMPLLVTGEPGTGKTRLANYVAESILDAELEIFNTKTTSKAKDLLYQYNTLKHFRDSQQGENVNPLEYISFRGLGKAITRSHIRPQVVLIDEIDKAPRDFPNDVLFEFENLAFRIDEASQGELDQFSKEQEWNHLVDDDGFIRSSPNDPNPFLILTSNSEKNLPDAFLRRCVYFHISFPDRKRLEEIIHNNVKLSDNFQANMLGHAIEHFLEIRDLGLRKKPATAELLAWIHILNKYNLDVKKSIAGNEEEIKRKLKQTYSLLTKTKEDREHLLTDLGIG